MKLDAGVFGGVDHRLGLFGHRGGVSRHQEHPVDALERQREGVRVVEVEVDGLLALFEPHRNGLWVARGTHRGDALGCFIEHRGRRGADPPTGPDHQDAGQGLLGRCCHEPNVGRVGLYCKDQYR